MELTKIEVAAIENAVAEATDCHLRELSNVQLAYVGGGNVEPTLA